MRHIGADSKSEKRAFTLIELLIVIAIIAILALIAVPNFLEAQVRAKIARAMADQRTIAVAVEAYTVDWGRPPLGHKECMKWKDPKRTGVPGGDVLRGAIYSRLTTPVAFISSVPIDPFADKFTISKAGGTHPSRLYVYQSVSVLTGEGNSMGGSYPEAASKGISFTILSKGPSRRYSADPSLGADDVAAAAKIVGPTAYPDLIYDATNGTVSFGYLMRSNKGGLQ